MPVRRQYRPGVPSSRNAAAPPSQVCNFGGKHLFTLSAGAPAVVTGTP